MAINVILPRQGQSVESCIITTIFKKVGDNVVKGEVLFAYETDKASFEEEAPISGVLLAVFCKEGDEVPVLENICIIGQAGESVENSLPADKIVKDEPKKEVVSNHVNSEVLTPVVNEQRTKQDNSQQFISPRAKKLAENEALTYSELKGSGAGGRIIEKDILELKNNRPKLSPLAKQIIKDEGLIPMEQGGGLGGKILAGNLASSNSVYINDSEVIPLSNIRKIIAKAMHQSLQNSAQLTHHLGADARKIQALRKKAKLSVGVSQNITLNDMVCYAVIRALKKYPQANAHFLGDSVRQFNKVHLGLAVDTDRGLMVPVIKNADDLSIQGLSSQMKVLAESCKKGNINPELLAPHEASFTVSNLGAYGVEMFTPVVNLPQVAILGVNTIIPRPCDMGDGIYGFVPYMGLSLTYDHRAIDGGMATQFLKAIAIEIETLNVEL